MIMNTREDGQAGSNRDPF